MATALWGSVSPDHHVTASHGLNCQVICPALVGTAAVTAQQHAVGAQQQFSTDEAATEVIGHV
jgi:hypothetical protein